METIDPRKLLLKVAGILEKLDIDYFITGGFAVSVWGRPRATFDIDIVVELFEPQVPLLAKALKKVSRLGYIDEETALEAVRQRGEFNFIDPETGLKVDFWIVEKSGRRLIEFKRRMIKKIDGQTVYFISPDDLILNKLLWHKEDMSTRHLEDIKSILKISKSELDSKYLKKWAEELNISDELNKLLL